MKKILFLVVVLISMVSVKLYSSNQELVFEEPSVMEEETRPPGQGGCVYREDDSDCSVGGYNGCAAIFVDGKCNSDIPTPVD